MELDIANAALGLCKRFPAPANGETAATFEDTHTSLVNSIVECKQKLSDCIVECEQKLSDCIISVVDNTFDSLQANSGCYGATSFMRQTIKNQDIPWVHLVGGTNGTVRMVRYELTQAYICQRYSGEPFAFVHTNMHDVANGKDYLANARSHLREIYKASDSTAVNDIEAFIAAYLTHDDRFIPSVRAALIEGKRNYQYVIWQ